jgi:2-oxoglutarate dehydrogenase E1 component
MKHLSVGSRWNADLLADYHERWKKDPKSVDADWAAFFEGFELGLSLPPKPAKGATVPTSGSNVDASAQSKVLAAIQAYRTLGHLQARINPLFDPYTLLRINRQSFRIRHIATRLKFSTLEISSAVVLLPLSEILTKLKTIYGGTIGVEYTHIQDGARRRWFQERVESSGLRYGYSHEMRRGFLSTLVQAEQFERFIHKTFVGAKRFSVEGGESMMVALRTHHSTLS